MFTVVRVTCTGFGADILAGILTAERPPDGFVVPSCAVIFAAAALRAGSLLAIAAFSAFTVPTLYSARMGAVAAKAKDGERAKASLKRWKCP